MSVQEVAVEKISNSLLKDPHVQAIYLKGSMGRDEHDAHSDIDLYCLVDQQDVEVFLSKRIEHLQAYRKIIFQDDIFIIAPQIIAVFDNLVHIDFFTVSRETFTKKDYFKVLYDPQNILEDFIETQSLKLNDNEYRDAVMDLAWFLYQYKKAAARKNDIWAARMLTNAMDHFARVLLYRYAPNRAQLGLKTVSDSLPTVILNEIEMITRNITPRDHPKAVFLICELVTKEVDWIYMHLIDSEQIKQLLDTMLAFHLTNVEDNC